MYRHARGPRPTYTTGRRGDLRNPSRSEFDAIDAAHRNRWFVQTASELITILANRGGPSSCSDMASMLNGGGFLTATGDRWTDRLVRLFVFRNSLSKPLI